MQFPASTPPPQFINGLPLQTLSFFLPHQEVIALPWVWESNQQTQMIRPIMKNVSSKSNMALLRYTECPEQ